MNRFDDPGVDIAVLATARFDHGEHALDKLAAAARLRAKRELPPDHGVTQRLFRGVVGRLDSFDVHERPQVFAMLNQLFAKAMRQRVVVTAQQLWSSFVQIPRGRTEPSKC